MFSAPSVSAAWAGAIPLPSKFLAPLSDAAERARKYEELGKGVRVSVFSAPERLPVGVPRAALRRGIEGAELLVREVDEELGK